MNRTFVNMKRIVFNSKLNRDKFRVNKEITNGLNKKPSAYSKIVKRDLHTFHPQNDPDWFIIIMLSFTALSVSRWINKR